MDLSPLGAADRAAATALLARACRFDPADQVADEKLFGPAPQGPTATCGAFVDGELAGVVTTSARWIRLIAVDPASRGKGIGSALLHHAELAIRAGGHGEARMLDQPGNYLAPGIDARNTDLIGWLERRGHARVGERHSLIVDVTTNPRVSAERARAAAERAAAAGYDLVRAGPAELARLAPAIEPAAWAFELALAASRAPSGAHLAIDRRGELAAFAARDGNNGGLGWFGPAWTREADRGRGLGEALLLACLADVAAAGHDHCVIAWIGPREFYARCAGIAGERNYIAMTRSV